MLAVFLLNASIRQAHHEDNNIVKIQSASDRILVKLKKTPGMRLQAEIKASIETRYGLIEVEYFDFIDVYLYKSYGDKENTIKYLNENPNISYAEPDFLRYAFPNTPDDPSFSGLWGLHNTGQTGGTSDADIDAPEAWDLTTGSSSVIVGVIDTGVDYNHTDLQDNMWTNPGETPNDGLDNDGNGYIDDYYGMKALSTGTSGDPMDDEGHGTHCAGTIAAKGNNAFGVTGVCWTAKIMALKFLDSTGLGYDSDAIKCIEYAISKGAQILSNSWGGSGLNQSLKNAIEAAKQSGILFIAAAGNDSKNNDDIPEYPASYESENIIAVAASDHNDNLATFSNFGQSTVDVAAPGVAILSTTPNNGFATYNGTSMATPHVSGLAALLLSSNPSLTWQEIKDQILNGVDQKSSLLGKTLTGGRINAYRSLALPTGLYRLTVLSSPDPGMAVTVIPSDFYGRGNGTTSFNRIYEGSPVVTLTAPSTFMGMNFQKWALNGVDVVSNASQTHSSNLQVTMDSNQTASAIYNMDLCEAVDNCALTWETGGDGGGWFGQTGIFQSGVDAAQSQNISDYQSAFLQTSVQGPQAVTFYWKVSSEENYDFLFFYIDDVKKAEISGNVDWHQKSILIESGTHTLKWVYSKDYSVSSGSDCGWVDNFLDKNSPVIGLSKNSLHFGASINGPQTPQEIVQVINNGGASLNWQSQTTLTWIDISPASGTDNTVLEISILPSGLIPGIFSGEIFIKDANAANSPRKIETILNIYPENGDSPPIGFFDTPTSGLTVSGSVPVTGWALDDIGIDTVEIKRAPDPDDPPAAIGSDGLVYIGDAVFVKDSRPDVEALYPDTPQNDRSGWGYMMLTYGLPRSGNGIFHLYAIAEDLSGQRTLLGTKQITSDNNNRIQPFGSIDTPGQGAEISGNYVNFGWVLTPPPKKIPINGSTIWISIDGVYIGNPSYNHFRQDIYDSFPGYLNRPGAVGYLYIDTTTYANGMHNIGWYAVDDNNEADGFGSRFFEIHNSSGTTSNLRKFEGLKYIEDKSGRLKVSLDGPKKFEKEEMGRIELKLSADKGFRFIGWGKNESKNLPIGSTLDEETGIFSWSIGPGFLGRHVLHFATIDGNYRSPSLEIVINILPKKYRSEGWRNKEIIR